MGAKSIFKGHITKTLEVPWTPEEAKASRLLNEYIHKSLDFVRNSDRGTQLVVQLVMHTFHKNLPWNPMRLQQHIGRLDR